MPPTKKVLNPEASAAIAHQAQQHTTVTELPLLRRGRSSNVTHASAGNGLHTNSTTNITLQKRTAKKGAHDTNPQSNNHGFESNKGKTVKKADQTKKLPNQDSKTTEHAVKQPMRTMTGPARMHVSPEWRAYFDSLDMEAKRKKAAEQGDEDMGEEKFVVTSPVLRPRKGFARDWKAYYEIRAREGEQLMEMVEKEDGMMMSKGIDSGKDKGRGKGVRAETAGGYGGEEGKTVFYSGLTKRRVEGDPGQWYAKRARVDREEEGEGEEEEEEDEEEDEDEKDEEEDEDEEDEEEDDGWGELAEVEPEPVLERVNRSNINMSYHEKVRKWQETMTGHSRP